MIFKKKTLSSQSILSLSLMLVAAALITLTGITHGQHIFRMLPLYISLVVGMLQAKANRYAPLIGSINSLLYAAVYFSFHVYGSALNALFISFPFQLATFVHWNQHAYKDTTEFRRMHTKHWLLSGAGLLAFWAVLYAFLASADACYSLTDSALTAFGLLTVILTMLRFAEYSWFGLAVGCLNLVLNVTMMQQHPEQITYLIYSVYSFICLIGQWITVTRIYQEQSSGGAAV